MAEVLTVPDLLADRLRATPDSPAFYMQGDGGAWHAVSWRQFAYSVVRAAQALAGAGVGPGCRVGILSPNHLGWEVAQHAVLSLGACVVGLDVHYPDGILIDLVAATGVEVMIVRDLAQWRRLPPDQVATVRLVCVMDGPLPEGGIRSISLDHPPGPGPSEAPGEALVSGSGIPDTLPALIVFSSGTTGTPKGIAYSQRQAVLAIRQLADAFPAIDGETPVVCWLPLANLFQRMINFCAMSQGRASFIVADPREVMAVLPRANPEIVIGVPRFFERVEAGMMATLRALGSPTRQIALALLAFLMQPDRSANPLRMILRRAVRPIAEGVLFPRLRAAFGTRVRFLVSGSAPLSPQTHRFFETLGLPVFEAYGVSENIVPIAMNVPGHRKAGTVGRVLGINEMRIADDGEVLVRGPGVFSGYLGPGAAAPDASGFWHTGDVGELDADGFLRLKGRKTDAFKLSTGRWVSPLEVEQRLRALPWVEHAVVVGAGRKVPVAILNCPGGFPGRTPLPGASDEAVITLDISKALEGLPSHQCPGGVLLVTAPFSIEGGEITTNLKLRRKAIEAQFAPRCEVLYNRLDRPAGPDARPMPVEVDPP
ncbi:MAG: AMP-binding protein [Betaproteobacteria bacterium]